MAKLIACRSCLIEMKNGGTEFQEKLSSIEHVKTIGEFFQEITEICVNYENTSRICDTCQIYGRTENCVYFQKRSLESNRKLIIMERTEMDISVQAQEPKDFKKVLVTFCSLFRY